MAGYLVTTVWWPDGWEPNTPLDVPKCLAQAREQMACELVTYPQAVATVRSLNQQNMDHPGATWHVVAKLADEPPPAVVDTRRLEVVQPLEGGGSGDCSHCPAHHLPCADRR